MTAAGSCQSHVVSAWPVLGTLLCAVALSGGCKMKTIKVATPADHAAFDKSSSAGEMLAFLVKWQDYTYQCGQAIDIVTGVGTEQALTALIEFARLSDMRCERHVFVGALRRFGATVAPRLVEAYRSSPGFEHCAGRKVLAGTLAAFSEHDDFSLQAMVLVYADESDEVGWIALEALERRFEASMELLTERIARQAPRQTSDLMELRESLIRYHGGQQRLRAVQKRLQQ